MNGIYIGDRQLEPDDDSYECPYCRAQSCNKFSHFLHVKNCQAKPIKEPEEE